MTAYARVADATQETLNTTARITTVPTTTARVSVDAATTATHHRSGYEPARVAGTGSHAS